MLRKSLIYILIMGMLLGLIGCGRTEEEEVSTVAAVSTESAESEESVLPEESQSELVEREPEILVCRVSDELSIGEQTSQALHILGKKFLDSRVGTQEESEAKIAEYGYCLIDYSDYGIARVYQPGTTEYQVESQLQNMTVQQDDRTWVVAYNATIRRWGIPRPSYDGPDFDFCDWTFGDWFIVHREGDVFQMMSYTDYQKLQKTNAENPFALYPVSDPESVEIASWDEECSDLGVARVTESGEYVFAGRYRSDTE